MTRTIQTYIRWGVYLGTLAAVWAIAYIFGVRDVMTFSQQNSFGVDSAAADHSSCTSCSTGTSGGIGIGGDDSGCSGGCSGGDSGGDDDGGGDGGGDDGGGGGGGGGDDGV